MLKYVMKESLDTCSTKFLPRKDVSHNASLAIIKVQELSLLFNGMVSTFPPPSR